MISLYISLALCRVELLFEQILRIDPKSYVHPISTLPSKHSFEIDSSLSHVHHSTTSLIPCQVSIKTEQLNEQSTLPISMARSQQSALSEHSSTSKIL